MGRIPLPDGKELFVIRRLGRMGKQQYRLWIKAAAFSRAKLWKLGAREQGWRMSEEQNNRKQPEVIGDILPFKEMMERTADDTLAYYRLLGKEGLILPTTGGGSLGQRSWCYNHTLPDGKAPGSYTTKDVWGIHGFPGDGRDFAGDV